MEHVVLSVRYEEIQNGNCINLYERTENIEIRHCKRGARWRRGQEAADVHDEPRPDQTKPTARGCIVFR